MNAGCRHAFAERRAPSPIVRGTARKPNSRRNAGLDAREEAREPPFYPDDLLPDLQQALALLANVEVRYEVERDCLEDWPGPQATKARLVAELEERRAADRKRLQAYLAVLRRKAAAWDRWDDELR